MQLLARMYRALVGEPPSVAAESLCPFSFDCFELSRSNDVKKHCLSSVLREYVFGLVAYRWQVFAAPSFVGNKNELVCILVLFFCLKKNARNKKSQILRLRKSELTAVEDMYSKIAFQSRCLFITF